MRHFLRTCKAPQKTNLLNLYKKHCSKRGTKIAFCMHVMKKDGPMKMKIDVLNCTLLIAMFMALYMWVG